ncbi:MAG: IMP cyclohydrolase [Clostridia bacterium]|nr:IMP cyclohydrolase [Clostridia bacterium]
MNTQTLREALGASAYPGRGIILGANENGRAVIAYFIMGRSANSRNRVFMPQGDGLRTEAFDAAKVVDPSLIIYNPVRVLGDSTIVTNGDQTDTIFDHMVSGGSFETALATRTFEPDAPNYTPRISGIVTLKENSFSYRLSILKNLGTPSGCARFFFDYDAPQPGVGHFIHTYKGDGNPLPSFEGEPERVFLSGDIDRLTGEIWDALDADNRISLFVRMIDPSAKSFTTRIINQNK